MPAFMAGAIRACCDFMRRIKAYGALLVVGICGFNGGGSIAAEEITVSSPAPIETPSLALLSSPSPLYGGVGRSGAYGAFIWNRAAGDGTTNLFLTRIDNFGRPVEEPPRL